MKVPEEAYYRIKSMLWGKADEARWHTLSDMEHSRFYEGWIRDEAIGGVLARFMRVENIRVYIKDTIMKPYVRERIQDKRPILRHLGIDGEPRVLKSYIKPHGVHLQDGHVICWAMARSWRSLLRV